MKNYYTILEIPESASAEMVKNAYRNLAKRWHPDLNPNDQAAEKMFMDIKEAYTVLSNAIKRNYYDYQLRKAILDKKVEPTSSTKVGSFRKKEQENTKKTYTTTTQTKQEKQEKIFHNSDSYKSRLDDLMKKHNELLEKEKKIAEANRKKQEKEKTFYDTFRENRDNAFAEQKLKQQQQKEEVKVQEEVKQTEEANITKPQKNRIKAILSILGFRSD
ncbi:MAG: DnaJ domain-containing protein [Raineya sp.]